MTNTVQLTRADTGQDMRADHFQDFSGEPSGLTHVVDFLGGFDGYCHECRDQGWLE